MRQLTLSPLQKTNRLIALNLGISLLLLLLGVSEVKAGSSFDEVKLIDLSGRWRFNIGDKPEWATPTYPDENWERIEVPSPWEEQGFHGFDGYAWYRTSFSSRRLQGENNLYLHLGYVDDVDEVYLNGELIGFSGGFPPDYETSYHTERKYPIPLDLLNESGDNIVAVRVYDAMMSGGLLSGNIGVFSHRDFFSESQSLQGVWGVQALNSNNYDRATADKNAWKTIMLPNFLNGGYDRWDNRKDIFWFKKEFELDDKLKTEELVLVLGKIDDFDVAYFNGIEIGRTNDGRPLGQSHSYKKLRIYPIPKDAINQNGTNTIVVKIIDIGGDAGIYQGPLLLTKSSNHREAIIRFR